MATVPTVVVAEWVSGRARTDADANRLFESRDGARRGAGAPQGALRARGRRGSVVDAAPVAVAEPGGTVPTADRADLEALASHADGVSIEVG